MSVHLAAWANLTNPSLLHQFALTVAVSQSGGHSSTTGLGAWGPGCGLGLTLHFCHQYMFHWVTSESCMSHRHKMILSRLWYFGCTACCMQSQCAHLAATWTFLSSLDSACSRQRGRFQTRCCLFRAFSSVSSPRESPLDTQAGHSILQVP